MTSHASKVGVFVAGFYQSTIYVTSLIPGSEVS